MFAIVPDLPLASHAQMAEVFRAVYGASTLVKRLNQPRLDETDDFSFKPRLLVRLDGGDRYALVSSEDADTLTHAAVGAISIAYVERTPDGWRLRARWDEFAWTGSTGRAASDFAAMFPMRQAPRVVATIQDIHQGHADMTRWTIALEKDGPRLLGMVTKDQPALNDPLN
jgi:hypothetical protein